MLRSRTSWSRGQHFDSDGTQIFFTDEGRGPPVVLVHGFAVSGDLNFRIPGITRALRAQYRVLSVDQRGHGQSDKPRGASEYGTKMVTDLVALLDHVGLQRAHVLGYSLGGFVALKLACSAAERLLSVGVLGAGFESEASGGGSFLKAIPKLADALEAGRGVGPLAGHLGSARARPSLRHRAWVRLVTRFLNDQGALVGVIRGAPELAVTAESLAALRLPVLSIVGDGDPLVAGARALRATASNCTAIEIPGADHVQVPVRAEFRGELLSFLRRHG
ncbi:MAG TPA: alpha/beta fold hydrolase [Polyangiaceae bacterium]|nr:alpha/beta fold hydrolase [Polyangiaceae bacterium]